MPENSTPRNLPHLTQQEISERDRQEDLLSTELRLCVRGGNVDTEKTFHLLCHYTLEIFDIHWSAYLKRPGFTRAWSPMILEQSILRAMVKADEEIYGASKQFYIALRDEVYAHLQQHPPVVPPPRPPIEKAFPALTGRQAAAYAIAGIDLTSSPLVMMAHEAASLPSPIPRPPLPPEVQAQIEAPPSTLADIRKAYVLPLLEEKGWSILDWATEADVAYHTAADFLAGKTKSYRSSRLKMAKALGISIQQLPK